MMVSPEFARRPHRQRIFVYCAVQHKHRVQAGQAEFGVATNQKGEFPADEPPAPARSGAGAAARPILLNF